MAEYLETAYLGFCKWDLPAFILLVAVVAFFSIRWHKLKKERKELEEGLNHNS